MRRLIRVLSMLCIMSCLSTLAAAATWTGDAGDGLWDTAGNWSGSIIPTTGDNVSFAQTGVYTVRLGSAITVNSISVSWAQTGDKVTLDLNGQSLTVTSASVVAMDCTLALNGGTLSGPGGWTINNSGTLSVSSGSLQSDVTLQSGAQMTVTSSSSIPLGKALTVNGTLAQSGSGHLSFGTGSSLTIGATGVYNISNTGGILDNGGGTVINNGTINKSGVAAASINRPLTNASTINVTGGTLTLTKGGSSTGSFSIETASTLKLITTAFSLGESATITGTGKLEVTSILSLGTDLTTSTEIVLNGGTLNGSKTLTTQGALNSHNGSTIASGVTVHVANGSTLGLSSASNHNLNGILNITGIVSHGDTGDLVMGTGAALTINAGGVYDLKHYSCDISGTDGTVVNNGTIKKTIDGGMVTISRPLTNTGTVDVQSGTLVLSGGGTSTAVLKTTAGKTLKISDSYTLGAGTDLTNMSGIMLITSALTLATDVTFPSGSTVKLEGGTISGSKNTTIQGLMDWYNGGNISTGSTVTVTVGATLTLSSASVHTLGGALSVSGTLNHLDTGDLVMGTGASVTVQTGGLYEFKNYSCNISGTDGTVNNNGVIKKTVDNGLVTISRTLNNQGTIDVQTGTLELSGSGTSTGVLKNAAGTTLKFSASYILGSGNSLTNVAGDILVTNTLSFSADATFPVGSTLKLEGGTLGGNKTITIAGSMDWYNGGTIPVGNTLLVASGATLNLTSASNHTLNGILTVVGTVHHQDTGDLALGSGASVTINSGGVYEFKYYSCDISGATGVVTNNGTIKKTVNTGTVTIKNSFVNTGTVDVQMGTLALTGGGSSSGTLKNAAGTTLHLASGYTFTSGNSVADISGDVLITSALTLGVDTTFPVGSTVKLEGGTLAGVQTTTIQGVLNWYNGGTIPTGSTLVLASGATAHLTSNSNHTLNGTFTVSGTVNHQDTGDLVFGTGAGLTINAGGVYDFKYYSCNISGTDGSITNNGIIQKTVDTGSVSISRTINNFGTIDVQTGTLVLAGGGSSEGTLKNTAGTTIHVSGVFAFGSTNNVANIAGTMLLTNTLSLDGNVTFPAGSTVKLEGGTISGSKTITIQGIMNWYNGGTIPTGNTLAITNGASLNLSSGNDHTLGGTLNVNGTVHHQDTGDLVMGTGSSVTIFSDGVYNFKYYSCNISGTDGTFTNNGMLQKTVDTGTVVIGRPLQNTGTIDVQTGTLNCTQSVTQSAGSVKLASGAVLQTASALEINGGSIVGLGQITGDVNNTAGSVKPAGPAAAGILTISGAYTQGSTASLGIELAGTSAGQYDRLVVSGAATLAGTLDIALIDSFSLTNGNAFQVLTYGSQTGDFTTVNGLLHDSLTLTRTTNSTDVVLNAGPNAAPVAQNGTLTVLEDSSVNSGTLTATDSEGNTITYALASTASQGTAVLVDAATGAYSYTPHANAEGSDSFTFTAADSHGTSSAATITITITPENDVPVAGADSYSVTEAGTLNQPAAGVLANDTDIDVGASLSVTVLSSPSNGSLSLATDGSFSYTHNGSETTSDSFTYTLSDGNGGTATGTVAITVTPVNDAPTADADVYSLNEGGTLNQTAPGVLVNDTDAEGNTLSVSVKTNPSHGTLTLNSNGSFDYVHDGSETTTDSFTYNLSDGNGGAATATVSLTITPQNDEPVAVTDDYSVAAGASLNQTAPGVLANDSDAENGTLTASVKTQPSHGTLVLNTDGSFTYTHDGSSVVQDSFTYEVSDGTGGTATGTVHITATTSTLVSFDTASGVGYEGGSHTIKLVLSEAVTNPLDVTLGASGQVDWIDVLLDDLTILNISEGTLKITIPAGQTSLSFTLNVVDDSAVEGHEELILTVSDLSEGGIGTQSTYTLTIRDNDAAVETLAAKFETGASSFSVGQTVLVRVYDGTPPYSFSTSSGALLSGKTSASVEDIDKDGDTDSTQLVTFIPHTSGSGSLVITDAASGSVNLPFIITTPSLTAAPEQVPEMPTSTNTQTIYTPISPGSETGWGSVRNYMANKLNTEARAAIWDARAQKFVEFPAEPTGGLMPFHACFIASRSSVSLDLTGPVAATPYEIPLLPGWNFIGIPVLDVSGVAVSSHVLATDFELLDEERNIVSGTARAAVIGSSAHLWDGTTYSSTTTLTSGNGYWIPNNSSKPGLTFYLRRKDGGTGLSDVLGASSERNYSVQDLGVPPSPNGTTSSSSASSSGSGGCGFGGIAGILALMFMGFIRMRLTTKE